LSWDTISGEASKHSLLFMDSMATLTSIEIIEYRAELAANPDALRALDMIEDCEGDLEDAAIALALQTGQEPDMTEGWLAGLAKRWRTVICSTELKAALAAGKIASAIQLIQTETTMPPVLITPVALLVLKAGVEDFCKPLEEKL
jgi:hypothetical protein